MAVDQSVLVRLLADVGPFQRGIVGAARTVDASTKSMSGLTGTLGKVGGAATIAGAAIVGLGAKAIKDSIGAFVSFDAKMNESTAIMGNLSESMRSDLAQTARDVALTTRFSADEAAESFFFLASAGLDANQSMAALPGVAKFAQAGMFDMAQATDLLTDAQSALGLTVKDAGQNLQNMTRISDVLVKANVLSNATVEQFSIALTSKLGASLKAVNKDVEEGVAVLAALADQGTKGAVAGQRLGRFLELLPRAARNNADAFAELNIEIFDAQGNFRSLPDIIGDMERAMGGMSTEAKSAAFQSLGLRGELASISNQLIGTSDKIRGYEDALRDASGITDEIATKQLDTLESQWGLIQAKVHDTALELGTTMAPALEDMVPQVSAMVDSFKAIAVQMGPALAKALAFALTTIEAITESGFRFMQFFHPDEEVRKAARSAAGLIEVMGVLRKTPDLLGADNVTRFANGLVELDKRVALTKENMLALASATGVNTDEQLRGLRAVREWLSAQGIQTEQIDSWIGAMLGAEDVTTRVADRAQEATDRQSELAAANAEVADGFDDGTDSGDDYEDQIVELADVLELATAQQKSLADAVKEFTSPTFAAVQAVERWQEAEKKVAELAADGKEGTDEYARALLDLAQARLEAQGSLDAFSAAGPAGQVEALADILTVSDEFARNLLESLGLLDGMSVTVAVDLKARASGVDGSIVADRAAEQIARTVTGTSGSTSGSIKRAAHGGSFRRGELGLVGEQGPELVRFGQGAEVIPMSRAQSLAGGGSTITVHQTFQRVAGDDVGKDIQRGVLLAGLSRYVETA